MALLRDESAWWPRARATLAEYAIHPPGHDDGVSSPSGRIQLVPL
jgi:hypothetical protein